MQKQVLFKVIAQGHEHTIYTTGEVDGFGENAIVFNYFPPITREFLLRQSAPPKDANCPLVAEVGTSSL
jgi:hypothetical protein